MRTAGAAYAGDGSRRRTPRAGAGRDGETREIEVTRLAESKLKSPWVDQLFSAFLLLRNPEECYRFFEDLCTVQEIQSMAQRLEVARLLDAGHKYGDIVQQTGASSATVSRVKRSLQYGADGYKLILARMKEATTKGGKKLKGKEG